MLIERFEEIVAWKKAKELTLVAPFTVVEALVVVVVVVVIVVFDEF